MDIRLTNRRDIGEVLNIYESARRFMLEHGNPTQWAGGYPGEDILLPDIENRHHFSFFEGGRRLGCFVFIEGDDPTYKEIIGGKWLNDNPYGVVHRMAALESGRGVGSGCIEWCFSRCGNLRIDTHPDNLPMQGLLMKNSFRHCGMIYNSWGDERLAYQKCKGNKYGAVR
jgi:hypothetical protein